jgi:nitroimidazol reductase NimA-like FMN-containing flavoprotein (pyridoxamine 5'-phosphate oxidase superfamily)
MQPRKLDADAMRSELRPTERTRLRRRPRLGVFDRAAINSILDEGLFCHVAFVDAGSPVVIPTLYARDGDVVYVHGSTASRMLRALAAGVDVCLTVTLVDGLVLARSSFHHSANYRSVVIFGRATPVEGDAEKLIALRALTEHVVPGRWNDVRHPNPRELRATTVLALPLEEASAKVRSGPPLDDEDDYQLPVWAGVIPIRLTPSPPEPDPRLPRSTATPTYATHYRRPAPSHPRTNGANEPSRRASPIAARQEDTSKEN